jgi:hypothetical protein
VGVLDELKKEAEAVAADKARASAARAQALASARQKIDPRMRKAFEYFEQLKQHLEVVNRKIVASYDIRGVGRVGGLVQGRYSVSAPNPDSLDKFVFRCVCAKSGVMQIKQDDTASVAAYRDYLRENGLKAKMRDTGRGSALFTLEAQIPVVVEFTANYERFSIRLRVRNLTTMGVARYTLKVEELEAKLLDEVAKAILRTENRFDEIVGSDLSKTGKIRLKKKIRSAMRQKELDDRAAERKAKKEQTLAKRFSRTLFGRKDDT